MKIKQFDIDLYHRRVLVFFSIKEAEKACPGLTGERSFGAQVNRVEDDKSGCEYISLTFNGDRHMTNEIIAHECVHIGVAVLDLAGIPVSSKNEEALAYVVGYCNEQVTKMVDKHFKNKKKGKKK